MFNADECEQGTNRSSGFNRWMTRPLRGSHLLLPHGSPQYGNVYRRRHGCYHLKSHGVRLCMYTYVCNINLHTQRFVYLFTCLYLSKPFGRDLPIRQIFRGFAPTPRALRRAATNGRLAQRPEPTGSPILLNSGRYLLWYGGTDSDLRGLP